MKKIKKYFFVNYFVYILQILFTVFSMIYLFIYNGKDGFISYPLYVIMFYFIICISIKTYLIIKKIYIKLFNTKYLSIYKKDLILKYKISLYSSTIINIIYAIFKILTGIIYKSNWLISFGIYYILLSILRVSIVKEERNKSKNKISENKKYMFVGELILFFNLILSIIIAIAIKEKIIITYSMWIVIAIAAYTFYILTTNIINIFRYKKLNSPIISASKIINFIISLVSLLSLEIVMLSTFGSNESIRMKSTFISLTGIGVCLIITSISIYMIVKSRKIIKENE